MVLSDIFLPKETVYVKENIVLGPIMTFGSSSFAYTQNDLICKNSCVVGSIISNCDHPPDNEKYIIYGKLQIGGKLIVLDKGRTKQKIEI
jgi:hypothetical protein